MNINLFKKQLVIDPFYLSKQPQLPPTGPQTGRRRAGAGRPECAVELTGITALVPGFEETNTASNKISKSILASTVSAHPTFWVYIPQLPSSVYFAEFELQVLENDGKQKDLYRAPLTLTSKPGIIGITPAKTPEYSLEKGKKYHWYLKVYCGNPKTKFSSIFLLMDGWKEWR
ncbi:MAG: DUF928 domain-containing protein [Calothrix sp. SM1_7_51]|nr:DUF928 domain-containing protein [Calothrix sp. SM1_7_51]